MTGHPQGVSSSTTTGQSNLDVVELTPKIPQMILTACKGASNNCLTKDLSFSASGPSCQ